MINKAETRRKKLLKRRKRTVETKIDNLEKIDYRIIKDNKEFEARQASLNFGACLTSCLLRKMVDEPNQSFLNDLQGITALAVSSHPTTKPHLNASFNAPTCYRPLGGG